MAASSRERAAAARRYTAADFDRPVVPLAVESFGVIAEIKDHSPAEGQLAAEGTDRKARASAYAGAGAAAVSILTEPERFAGSLAHLDDVAAVLVASRTPVMRKDFLVDVRQVLEARANGASGVLLIAAMLDDADLASMLAVSYELGMFVLLEAFDETDLARCTMLLGQAEHADRAEARQLLIGVNTRNLRTLEVDPDRLERLASRLPGHAVAVAESGLAGPADAARVARQGYAAGLVGTALMKSADPGTLVAAMLEAGRSERGT